MYRDIYIFLTQVVRPLLFCPGKLLFSDVLVTVVAEVAYAPYNECLSRLKRSKGKNTLPLRYTFAMQVQKQKIK